jgi:MFS transporter, DHA1 family, multidrug resistance protein
MSVLLAALFVVMVGYGSTLTVLPDHIQRSRDVGGTATGAAAFHVGLIVGVYALAGLAAGPVAGRVGDRWGRRPLLLAGLGGLAATQVLFGLSTSLRMLYLLRVLGGLADASLLVSATAYIADATSAGDRARGMAWFGTAISLGLVAGPALTGFLTGVDVGIVQLDGHAIPFVFSGVLAASVLALAGRHLPDARPVRAAPALRSTRGQPGLRAVVSTTGPLLLLVLAAQYGLAIFEGMFVLYARGRLSLTLAEIAVVFMVCGAVLAVQLPAVGWLNGRMSSVSQVAIGFGIMGASLVGLLVARSFPLVLAVSAAHGAGGTIVIPNLSALVSSRTPSDAGLALGLRSSASGIGQFLGPLVGGALMGLQAELPFLVAGVVLMGIAATVHRALRAEERSSAPLLPVDGTHDTLRIGASAGVVVPPALRRVRPVT